MDLTSLSEDCAWVIFCDRALDVRNMRREVVGKAKKEQQ